jgi:hypothetical protein
MTENSRTKVFKLCQRVRLAGAKHEQMSGEEEGWAEGRDGRAVCRRSR